MLPVTTSLKAWANDSAPVRLWPWPHCSTSWRNCSRGDANWQLLIFSFQRITCKAVRCLYDKELLTVKTNPYFPADTRWSCLSRRWTPPMTTSHASRTWDLLFASPRTSLLSLRKSPRRPWLENISVKLKMRGMRNMLDNSGALSWVMRTDGK